MTVAAPTSSSTVVPFAASPTSNPPICASDASPDMMWLNASRASAREVLPPAELEQDVADGCHRAESITKRGPNEGRGNIGHAAVGVNRGWQLSINSNEPSV
jgi:hypothetical protein